MMPDVSPFRGVRYDVTPSVGSRLSDVVCASPYDVIDRALQDRLYQSSPYNIVRLELNRPEPGDRRAANRYTRAAGFLQDWLRQGVLRPEDHPALYVYRADLRGRGKDSHSARDFWLGFVWSRSARARSFPHEQTLAGPKADRLALYQATGLQPQPDFRTLSRR